MQSTANDLDSGHLKMVGHGKPLPKMHQCPVLLRPLALPRSAACWLAVGEACNDAGVPGVDACAIASYAASGSFIIPNHSRMKC